MEQSFNKFMQIALIVDNLDKYVEGKETLVEVLNGEKTRGFTYLDTFKDLGFNIEIHKGLPG